MEGGPRGSQGWEKHVEGEAPEGRDALCWAGGEKEWVARGLGAEGGWPLGAGGSTDALKRAPGVKGAGGLKGQTCRKGRCGKRGRSRKGER